MISVLGHFRSHLSLDVILSRLDSIRHVPGQRVKTLQHKDAGMGLQGLSAGPMGRQGGRPPHSHPDDACSSTLLFRGLLKAHSFSLFLKTKQSCNPTMLKFNHLVGVSHKAPNTPVWMSWAASGLLQEKGKDPQRGSQGDACSGLPLCPQVKSRL